MNKLELLAPAGNLEKAKIAFKYGADAVYAGTAKLSLRSRSDLDSDSLKETIEYAHSIGKKVYVALNIYANDTDYKEIEEEILKLKEEKADAIIASDVGIIETIKRLAPDMEIHISTQANTVSLHAANFWYKYGAKRVVISRELSRERIKYIMENKPKDLEVEMFVHGAICYAYSGRCYLSKYLTGRCANQGDCAQPCRWQYNITASEVNNPESKINIDYDEKGTYLFSSKDMCLINQIPALEEMGVESLKIEGRLKTEYYLATVVRAYRKAIDEYLKLKSEGLEDTYDSSKYLRELEKVKTRGYQDIHDLDGKSENMEYEYAAKVIGKDEVNKELTIVEIKNKISINDHLEILPTDTIESLDFTVQELYDIKTNERIDTINPGIKGQQVKIKIPYEVDAGLVIRRKK